MLPYIIDQEFTNQNTLEKGEYENCVFENCDFSNQNLSGYVFIDCDFYDCNLSMVQAKNTAFRKVLFINCKMLGINFQYCNTFGLDMWFDKCQLNHCVFYKLDLKNRAFLNSPLQNTDFTECNLSNSLFKNCDLQGAVFDRSILENTDFETAYNFSINPENNILKGAKFSINNLSGLLHKYKIEIKK